MKTNSNLFEFTEDIKKNLERIEYLVSYLNDCTVAYDAGNPKISDKEWDNLYFELLALENHYDYRLKNSPTQVVYFNSVSELKKVTHNHAMLSLEKTKDLNDVRAFAGNKEILAMCKMDGLTCSLTYKNGRLVAAETRGNGIIGEDILHNAMVIPSIPKSITYKEDLVVDGEIICTVYDFEKFASIYKNPRNFAAGSIRLLDARECAERDLTFVAWEVKQGYDDVKFLNEKLDKLSFENFTVVPYESLVISFEQCVENLKTDADNLGYPIDGCVFKFNDVAYGDSLGATSHHFKNAIAYKFYDETYPTKLLDIEWTMGRTGVLTPVAVFEPLDIDGSVVERASVHNISVMKNLFHGLPFKGQNIEVFKANMIIPQIYSAEDINHISNYIPPIEIPDICPICGGKVEQITEIDSTMLRCENPACDGKLINVLDHFCGKKGLDIKGLSKMTLEKLIDWGWVTTSVDLFTLGEHRTEWIAKPGFGVKSVDKILEAIETSRHCDFSQFIAALGIPLIGTTIAKELVKTFPTWDEFYNAIKTKYPFYTLQGFGYEMHSALYSYNYDIACRLANDFIIFNSMEIVENNDANTTSLENMTFVVTGKLTHFKNRDALVAKIESLGGKVTSSVSKNTSYLINNDIESNSSKNKTAKTLNIPILSEEDFLQTFGID
jgi:DNA ligase (NAD+)